MKTTWKLFALLNILQVFVLLTTFVIEIFRNDISFEMLAEGLSENLIAVLILIGIPSVVITNCFYNILFLKFLQTGKHFTQYRKVFFWLISFLFLLVIMVMVMGALNLYSEFKNE